MTNTYKLNIITIIFSLGISVSAHAQWLEAVPTAAAQALGRTALTTSIKREFLPLVTRIRLADEKTILNQNNFVKDILRKGVQTQPEIYIPQVQIAREVYGQLSVLQQNNQPLLPDTTLALQQQLSLLTLMDSNACQLWIATLATQKPDMKKYNLLLNQMQRYYGFGTQEDVELLSQRGELLDNPTLQRHRDLYNSFAHRLETFISQYNRLPQQLRGLASEEEISLAQELRLFEFMSAKNNFYPLNQYIKRIETAIESVSH